MAAYDDSDRLKIILGIDYGTTFTGISYVTSEKTTVNDIDVLRVWPGNGCPVEGNWKAPTIIAYQSENPSTSRDHWGYEVRPNMKACSWTKLLLDTSAETAEFDDPSIRDAVGSETFFHLPNGKSPQQVCQDYLTHVYGFVTNNLKSRMTAAIFDVTPMECYLTMPAIWTDKAQVATKAAAMAAGFGSRPFDTIHMIAEPEAAAIAALKHDLRPGSLHAAKVGDNILVLDCGGGTVDITTYYIRATYPTPVFDELCVGAGGKCGATYLDRNFHKLLIDRFGQGFEDVPGRFKGPGSRFMMEFEKAKHSFGSADNDTYEIGPIPLGTGHCPEHFDEEEECVILSRRDMETIFDPVIKDVLRLVKLQVIEALCTQARTIGLIVLVGGFGNSDYLKQALEKWAEPHGIQCIRPNFCQAAVVRGAAIRGLQGTAPSKLICRRHYGFVWGEHFIENVHDEKNAYWNFGQKFSAGHMNWVVEKGSGIDASTYKTVDLARTWRPGDSRLQYIDLYSCNLDGAPARREDLGMALVGRITMNLSDLDMSTFETRQTPQGVEHRLEWQLRVDLRTTDGVLRYTSVSKGKTLGVATIDFKDH